MREETEKPILLSIPRCVLVMSGSRALERSSFEAAARKRAESAVLWAKQHEATIFVGDAKEGTDRWAAEHAGTHLVPVWGFLGYSGEIILPDSSRARWLSPDGIKRLDIRNRYLARNRQMTSMAAMATQGRIYAQVHRGSETKGTEHTITCAEAVGLLVWRDDYGP